MKRNNQDHKAFVKAKFDRIVRRYDLVNSLGSFYQDYFWRKAVAKLFKEVEGPFLDLCSGPFTLSFEILKVNPSKLFALDLSFEMLLYGKSKVSPLQKYIYPIRGDAERLPFKEETFGAISIAFGLRNLPDRAKALQEFYRVLKPGGLLVILEFSKPKNFLFRYPYLLYLKYGLSFIGGLLTGDKEAYQYLASSIEKFPPIEEIHKLLEKNGFKRLLLKSLTLGVVTLYAYIKEDLPFLKGF
jgi:demethylmenaquinone methyltransferase/2-methoxy-6-polyprenyl-1,4-benzoquinol methylase